MIAGFGEELRGTAAGREILARDWSATDLGPPDRWPASLVSLLSMMLGCPTPMFLAWGPGLRTFYNDAYRPVLGNRADQGIGTPFRVMWGDIWDDIGPLVDATLAGQNSRMTDMKLDLARDNRPEESWWTFRYSPVHDESGVIAGLFCVTAETTAKVVAERAREAADERLQMALSAGNSIGAWDWDVVADRVTADPRFASLYGIDPDQARTGAPIADFFGGIHPDDLPRVQQQIGAAIADGSTFASEYRLISSPDDVRWVSAQGRCVMDADGKCVRFPGISFDVTERKLAEIALQAAKDERDFVVGLIARQRELDTADAILNLTLEALARRLHADRVGFQRQLSDGRTRIGPCWTSGRLPALTGDFDADAFGKRMQDCHNRGSTITYADAANDPDGGLDELAAAGVTSGLCAPVMRAERFAAAIFVHGDGVRSWTAGEVALVREVAEMTMVAVERAEALSRLESRVGQQEDALVRQAGELRDQTAGRSAAESQVRQLQKMEALGQLTGGIAHDFNNMLAVVIGGLNLMQRRLERGDAEVGKYVDAAMDGAMRAAALTQRLLAFARQSPLAPEAVDANVMVHGLTDLLDRTLGEGVRLQTALAPELWRARADPGQLENVLVNLAVNARDAMPDGGRLTIATGNAHLEAADAAAEEIAAGDYVEIAVSDTGTGMTPEVMAKAFDPFFTTKGVGKGTGLGLSQVFGFVRQSGGHVRIHSDIGEGTTIRLLLPRIHGDPVPAIVPRVPGAVRGGSANEVVMVVEDEQRLRDFTVEALRELGYSVVHAADGAQALAMIAAGQTATLLFTDVVMPGMTGRALAEAAVPRLPGLRVLYTTGYMRDAGVLDGEIEPGINVLAKPFGIDQLAAKVREVLDTP